MMPQQQLLNELASLRNARGAAVLDGRRFDGRRLAQVETELAALDDAEAEGARRAHEAHEAAAVEHRKGVVQRITELNGIRLAALERAEKFGREMAAALDEVFAASRGISETCRLGGIQQPYVLDQKATEQRVAQCVVALLQPLGQARSAFGDLRWRLPPAEASGSWVDMDRKLTGPIVAILTKETP